MAGLRTQISRCYGNITPAEERLLLLTCLDISPQDMSRVLAISASSIRTLRYRMRKKYGIAGDATIAGLLDDRRLLHGGV